MYLFLLMQISYCQNLKTVLQILIYLLFNISYPYWNVLTCANKVENCKASMLSPTNFVCLALAVSYVLLCFCPLSNSVFFLLIVVDFRSIFFFNLRLFFSYFVAYFCYYASYEVMYANHCILCTIFHFR